MPELKKLQGYLKRKGIDSEIKATTSSNVFMQKLWVVVSKADFPKAGKLAEEWLKKNESMTQYIHDADIPKGRKKVKKVV